ncbi:MAG: PorT family protein [Saprospiraceae bacterium]|nr:PorT family protein [Saprospiraceae bacterium]
MKKLLSFLIITLVGQTIVFGQFELRPTLGITRSAIKDFKEVDFKSEMGFSFGVDLLFGDRMYLQPGVHYETTKNSLHPDAGGSSTLKVSKVRIPLLVGFKLFDTSSDNLINVRAFTGPNMSLVTSTDDGDSPLAIRSEDLKTATFGWNAGVGVDFLLFFVDLNYQFGLSDFFDDNNIQGIEGQNSKNNIFYLNAGLKLKF